MRFITQFIACLCPFGVFEVNMLVTKALLFDLDGTLVDTTIAVETLWKAWADKHKIDAAPIFAEMHGTRGERIIAKYAPHLDIKTEITQLLIDEEILSHNVIAVPGAKQIATWYFRLYFDPSHLGIYGGRLRQSQIAAQVGVNSVHPAGCSRGPARSDRTAGSCRRRRDCRSGRLLAHASARAARFAGTSAHGPDQTPGPPRCRASRRSGRRPPPRAMADGFPRRVARGRPGASGSQERA